jgi:RHS repeat-associated protein
MVGFARFHRVLICLMAVLVAVGLTGSGVARELGAQGTSGRQLPHGTSMAALAPQLLAAPGADPVTGAAKQPACTQAMLPAAGAALAVPGRATALTHDGAAVRLGAGAVRAATRITAQSLCADSLAPMDQGMTNVTAGPRRGYRFLPHMNFAANLRITLPYDPALIPLGLSAQDMHTFYYDTKLRRWQALRLLTVDTKAHTITSSTGHFTDFVTATITPPDAPGTLSYDPTTIKDIKAADPGANVNLIDRPQAGSDGAAHLSYPIELPQGRHDQAPSLAITYDSSGGPSTLANGWLGLGWNLALPAVEVSTQWGVPTYDQVNESETYTLNGAELTPVANRGALVPRTAEKVFHTRIEENFSKIVRHGSDPRSYWWEVTEKNGTREFFGGTPQTGPDQAAELTDASGNIFRWALEETQDLDGNTVHYSYTHVSDAGIPGGTVMGTNLYPASINYTGTGDAAGAYTVTFTRDRDLPGYTRRSDVAMTARGGFLMVTADLLKQIDITFNGQEVRGYQLGYTTGAFGKTLLRSITQLGANGDVFNTHTFAYYDDAQDGNGNYNGFSAPTAVNTGGDNVTAGLFGQGRASALSGSETSTVDSHFYGGFNLDAPNKNGSAGAKVGFTQSSTDGVLLMIDLNGDGKPDKVFEQNGEAYFRLNTTVPGGPVTFSDQANPLPTLPAISHTTSNEYSFGPEAYFDANVLTNTSQGFTTENTYFQDVNGDGLPDLVENGRVLFNHLDANGIPTFTPNSADTPVPIGGGTVDTSGISIPPLEQQASASDPLVDTLRVWTAPYTGTVSIAGGVTLIQDTSAARAQYTTADGVRVAIQQNGAELWSTTIGPDDYTPHTPAGVSDLPVTAGDRIYFRSQSVDDGSYDQVSWDPIIAYQNVTPATDVNGLDVYTYQASKDFTLAGRSGAIVQAPLTGTVHLAGTFHKAAPTTDDVTVEVLQNGSQVFAQTMPAAQTGDIPVSLDLQVSKGDTIALREKIDSPIDVTQLSWAPELYYTSSPSATVTDANGNPVIQLHPPVDTDLYPADDLGGVPQQAWAVPSDGTVTVSPQLTVASGANGTVTFTVKRQGALVFKEPITISGGSFPDPSFSLPVTGGDQLYFDYSATDPALAAQISGESVQVAYDGQSAVTVPSALHFATTPGVLPEAYRGWAYVGYNGDGVRDTQPIVESDLTQAFTSASQYDPTTAKAYPLVPSPADGAWQGANSNIFVKAGQVSSSRVGAPTLSVPAAVGFAGARAPSKVSDSSQTAIGGGVSLLSGSTDSGTTTSDVDYLDMNGSGFPAVVSNGHVQYPDQTGALQPDSVLVHGLGAPRTSDAGSVNVTVGGTAAHFKINAQSQVDNPDHAPNGNSTGSQMVALGLSGSLGKGESHPQSDLIDMNGDGLPDVVTRDGDQLMVSLNLGYSFAPAEPWGTGNLGDGASENGSIGVQPGFNGGIYDFAGGLSLTKDKSETSEQLISMTGSGLPDRVINTPAGMEVAFNTGTGFAPAVPWPGAPNGACADNTSVGLAGIDWNTTRLCNGDTSQGAGSYFTIGIGPLCEGACYIILNPGADASQSMSREEGALRDVAGSSAPDYVSSGSDGQLTVSMNNIGRTNLLKSVSRPLGATITLDYQPTGNTYQLPQQRWVMSHVTVSPGGSGDEVAQETSYEYSGGSYNRLERTFYGFGTVTEHDLDTTNSDAVYRTTVRDYDTSSYYTQGLPLRTRVYDASGKLFTDTQLTYDTRDVLTGADPADTSSTTATIFPMLVRTDESFYEGGTVAQKTTFSTQHYDALGNIDQTTDAGDPGTGEDVLTSISYANCPGTYLESAPASVVATDVNGKVLRHREQDVDCGTGDVTEVREYLADGSFATTDMSYLPDGMLATVTNPPNSSGQRYQLSYTYDSTVGTYVTSTTDSFGLTSASAPDLRFGTTASETDVNGNVISYTVDEFGRTTTVTGPYQQGTGIATIAFEYHPDAAIPWTITHNADVFRGPGATIDTVTFIDGLKRVIQTKKSAAVFTGVTSAAQDVMQVSGHVTFDPFGRAVATTYPVTEPLGTPGVYNATVDPVRPTTSTFDVLDRDTGGTLPDGATSTTAYGFGPDRSGTVQFMTTVTDANGHQTVTFHNARNLLTGQEQFHNGTPIWTSYAYDPLGEVISVTDDHGKVTTDGYDMLGRQIDVTSPDSGDTQSVYDLAGNRVASITPNLRAEGKQISYGYDFNRLVTVSYPDNPGNNVTYTYGAPGAASNSAGRVIQVTDASGTTQQSYGKLGELTYEARTVNTTVGTLDPTYVTQYTYDTFGRLQQLVYPDGETLTYHYDSGGLVSSVTGTKGTNSYTYVSRLEYDKFGAKAYLDYGNGVTSSYSYNPLNRRLASLQSAPAGGGDFQNISYTYDNVGNLTAITNDVAVQPNGQNGGPTSQQFGYDDLDRLTSASGTYDFAPGKQNTYTLSLSYDSINNVLEKNQLNEVIEPSGRTKMEPASYDSTYAYNGAQEHAPTHIGGSTYTYDANGNQTGNTTDASGQRQTITWNEASQIQSLSNNGQETDYVYDDAGNRVIKRGALGETVYVNQYFTIRNGEIGTKQVIIGGTVVAEQIADHDPTVYEAKQYFFQDDQIGSSNYVTDATGNVFEHNEYFPTGETWVQEASDTNNIPFGFAGKEFDPESGFYYMGARYYDPVTGIFESPDTVLASNLRALNSSSAPNIFAPTFLNLYNYADDQPLTKTDPDGLAPVEISWILPRGTRPLYSRDLYRIARERGINIEAEAAGEKFIDVVGDRFEALALKMIGGEWPLEKNTKKYPSLVRFEAMVESGMFPWLNVIPDFVGPEVKFIYHEDWDATDTIPFPESAFLDVKSGSGTIHLKDYDYQILGILDVASRSSANQGVRGEFTTPTVIFVTVWDKEVGWDVADWGASGKDVAIYQIKAYYDPLTDKIGFTWAVPVNRTGENQIPLVGFFNTELGDL